MLRKGVLFFAICATFGFSPQAAGQAPTPGAASDSASVRIVLQAVLEKLAPASAAAALHTETQAYIITTPPTGPFWDRAHAWLAQLLRARPAIPKADSVVRLVLIESAVVRSDSLVARFTIGATLPNAHRSPSTTYELVAKWNGTGWGRPDVRATLFVD